MSGYWSRLFVMFALFVFVVPIFAADRNYTAYNESTYYHACERLLDANLTGYFIATDVTTARSEFVTLRRLGTTSAYVVASGKMDMPEEGIRELEPGRLPEGWLLGDPENHGKRVNILSIERENGAVRFNFADVADVNNFPYRAIPHEDVGLILGDILNPDGWILNMEAPYRAQYRFTRVKFDRTFEQVVSQSLKSILADRSEAGRLGTADHIVIVEMKMPLTLEEAQDVLNTDLVFPLQEQKPGTNMPTYRFAVGKNFYTLLESIGDWTRQWQVAHVDAIPGSILNPSLMERVIIGIRAGKSGTTARTVPPPNEGLSRTAAPPAPPVIVGPPKPAGPDLNALEEAITGSLGEQELPQEPSTSAALAALNRIGGNIGGGQIDPKSLQPPRNQQHPRNLDEDHENGHDDEPRGK